MKLLNFMGPQTSRLRYMPQWSDLDQLTAVPQAENGIGRKVVPHGHHLLRPHVLVVN